MTENYHKLKRICMKHTRLLSTMARLARPQKAGSACVLLVRKVKTICPSSRVEKSGHIAYLNCSMSLKKLVSVPSARASANNCLPGAPDNGLAGQVLFVPP